MARCKALSIPIFSITSLVSRSPAVSRMVTASPFKSSRTSITSRVVPAISDVIAASRPTNAFKSVDFPIFGGPTIATSKPSLIRSATKVPASSVFKSCNNPAIRPLTSGTTSTGTSSSAKSIVASINDAALIKSARHPSIFLPIAPERTCIACFR